MRIRVVNKELLHPFNCSSCGNPKHNDCTEGENGRGHDMEHMLYRASTHDSNHLNPWRHWKKNDSLQQVQMEWYRRFRQSLDSQKEYIRNKSEWLNELQWWQRERNVSTWNGANIKLRGQHKDCHNDNDGKLIWSLSVNRREQRQQWGTTTGLLPWMAAMNILLETTRRERHYPTTQNGYGGWHS